MHVSISFIITIIISLFFYNKDTTPYLTISILSSLCHLFIISYMLRFNRIKNSLTYIFTSKHINVTTILCLILLALITPMPNNTGYIQIAFVLFFFIATLAFLIYWWKAQLKKAYKQMIIQRNTESLRATLQGKEREIEELTAHNHELGHLLHKYNKLIPALEHAVCEYLSAADEDITHIHEKGHELLSSIETLTADRKLLMAQMGNKNYVQQKTEIASLDTLLNYLSEKSIEQHITFTVNSTVALNNYVPHSIPENLFTHMISDLLDNAFVAVRDCPAGMIQLQFYTYADDLILEVADNGIPFETQSLVNFGLKELTTHKDTGGSGMGLIDIWKHKETCKATIHIEEYATPAPFAKKIAIIFNRKNKYTISTYRETEILNKCNRLDMQVYSQTLES